MFRAVSIRTPEGRLTFSGLAADSPYLAEMVDSTRLDSPAFEASPGLTEPQRKTMRRDLAAWAAQLQERDAPDEIHLSPEQLEVIQDHGYWGAQ